MSIRDSLGMLWGSAVGSRTPVDKTTPLPVALYSADGSGNPAAGGGGTANPYPGSDYAKDGTLPSGAATAAKQDSIVTKLGAVVLAAGTAVIGSVTQSGSWDIRNVSGTISLPTNAAQDGADPASPAVANGGTGIRGWLATIAGLLKLGTQTKANSGSVTIATDQGNLEPGGVAITGAALPAGGVGLTGWLSAVWQAAFSRSQFFAPVAANAALASSTATATAERSSGGVAGGSAGQWPYYQVLVASDQALTLNVFGRSASGGGNVTIATASVAANTPTVVKVHLFPILIAQVVNGSTAATKFTLVDGFTAA